MKQAARLRLANLAHASSVVQRACAKQVEGFLSFETSRSDLFRLVQYTRLSGRVLFGNRCNLHFRLIFLRFKRSLRDGHLKYSRLHYEYTMRTYWKPTRHCADRPGKQPRAPNEHWLGRCQHGSVDTRSLPDSTRVSGDGRTAFTIGAFFRGRVETWRGGVGRAYPLAGTFVCRCLTSPTVLRVGRRWCANRARRCRGRPRRRAVTAGSGDDGRQPAA